MTGSDVVKSCVERVGFYDQSYLKVVVKHLRGGLGLSTDYDPVDVATLFHELLHHVQYISTVGGISYFDNLISIWHNARNSRNSSADATSVTRIGDAREHLRNFSDNNKHCDVNCFSSIDIDSIDVGDGQLTYDPVKIEACWGEEKTVINFGIYEFFESSAYVLERMFRKKIGLSHAASQVSCVPYKIGEAIARFYDPCCSDNRLIMIMLTSMLHPSPHQTFAKFANDLSLVDWDDSEVRHNLELTARELSRLNTERIGDLVSNIRRGFPVEDPHFGDLVVDLFRHAEFFFQRRAASPMLELDFLDDLDLANYGRKVAEFGDLFGGILVFEKIETHLPNGDGYERVLPVGTKGGVFHDLHKLEVFQASIHYAMEHVGVRDGVVGVSVPSCVSPCPLLSSCSHINKELNSSICASHPWQHPKASDGSVDCAYQIAAFGFDLANTR